MSSRTQLLQWIEAGAIPPDRVSAALVETGVTPGGLRWRRFLELLMLGLGSLFLVCAVAFFVAYNWDALGCWGQFVLLQALLLTAILAYWMLGTEKTSGKMALTVAALLLGALLALYGQTYQTGADSWQLFATWAVLMLPWVLVGRFSTLWLLLLALLNLAIILYFQTFRGWFWFAFNSTESLLWALVLLNTTAWICWELAAVRYTWLAQRWAVRLIALAGGTAITILVLLAIFEPGRLPILAWMVYAAWLASLHFVYRRKRPDLFMLAGGCLSLIVCVTSFLANLFLGNIDTATSLLLLALLVIVQAASVAAWLRHVHAEQPSS